MQDASGELRMDTDGGSTMKPFSLWLAGGRVVYTGLLLGVTGCLVPNCCPCIGLIHCISCCCHKLFVALSA